MIDPGRSRRPGGSRRAAGCPVIAPPAAKRETGNGPSITEEMTGLLPKGRCAIDERLTVELTSEQVQVHQWAPRARQPDGFTRDRDASIRDRAGAPVPD